METLVMSQVAPGIGHHPYHHHHMMVGGNTHQEDEANETPSQHQSDRAGSTAAIPQINENADQNSSQHPTPAQPATLQDQRQTNTPTRPESQRNISYASQQAMNHHSRGFDQSGFPLSNDPRAFQTSPSSPRLQPTYRSTRSLGGSEATSPSRIKVRDLSHIQSFASEEYLARPRLGHRTGSFGPNTQFEISAMPVTDIIEMVAGLLTKITTTNDRQHEHLHKPTHTSQEQGSLTSPSQCVLAFHGKNVPGITIMSYLSRIHKYCPTTYEVFLSLLVYFDRMTDNFNRKFMQKDQEGNASSNGESSSTDGRNETQEEGDSSKSPMSVDSEASEANKDGDSDRNDLSQYFVVDSYNIHRLVIAGVTCASKFFSDVFYTNSRYAKVGGLPLMELNNLELQFLLLNDFRLSIPVEELEAYGTMLVEFYAREIVAQEQAARVQHERMQQTTHTGDEMYMRGSERAAPQANTQSQQ